jgi:hypothetical protein
MADLKLHALFVFLALLTIPTHVTLHVPSTNNKQKNYHNMADNSIPIRQHNRGRGN